MAPRPMTASLRCLPKYVVQIALSVPKLVRLSVPFLAVRPPDKTQLSEHIFVRYPRVILYPTVERLLWLNVYLFTVNLE